MGVGFTGGVSDGFAELFLCGVGVFPAADFFFFFGLAEVSLAGLFFGFGCALASGVSVGVAEAAGSSAGVFFFFDFGVGVAESEPDGRFFFFLCGDVLDFGLGVGDLSLEVTASALRIGVDFSSSLCCA